MPSTWQKLKMYFLAEHWVHFIITTPPSADEGVGAQETATCAQANADSPSSAGLQSRPCWRCLLLSVGWHCGTLHAGGPVHLCSISASFPIRLLQPEHILSLLTIRSSMLVLPAAVLARRPLSSSNADKSAGQDAAEPGAWSA